LLVQLFVVSDEVIRQHLSLATTITLVEAAFAADATGKADVLPVVGHSLNQGRYSIKTSHLEFGSPDGPTLEVFGLKLGSYFPDNAARQLPTHSAAMLLGNPQTGQPLALLAANTLTEYRTAAGGAVAAKYLAKEAASRVALLGTGHQARAQLEALREVRPISEVSVWSRRPEAARQFVSKNADLPLKLTAVETPQAAAQAADIIVTITPAQTFILPKAAVKSGTHINAMGCDAPGKQELEPRLVASAKVVVDNLAQSVTIGELQEPLKQNLMGLQGVYASLGELCSGQKVGRETADEITVFDSSGVSFQDTVVAGYIVELVRQHKLGLCLDL
jgi:alanine dehydrogenase